MSGGALPDQLVRELMTLAGIAYGKPSAIPRYLATDPLTKGRWMPIWVAADLAVPETFAYIARNQDSDDYVIAIRGTYPNPLANFPAYFDGASFDYPLGPMQIWPNGAATGAKVSNGTWNAFNNLVGLSDGVSTFPDALEKIPTGAQVYVTGHSLGGTLAPVVALWLYENSDREPPTIAAFAGMTPGNGAFAKLFDPWLLPGIRAWRYNNSLDTVPYGWNDVLGPINFYQPAPQGGAIVEAMLLWMADALVPYGFTAIGAEIRLPGVLEAEWLPIPLIDYLLENLHQHMPDTYLALLGAPPLPFTIGIGAVVVDKDVASVAQIEDGRVSVFYASS